MKRLLTVASTVLVLATAACQRHHPILCTRFTDVRGTSYRMERGTLDGATFTADTVNTFQYMAGGATPTQVAAVEGKFMMPTALLAAKSMSDVRHSAATYNVGGFVYVVVQPQ